MKLRLYHQPWSVAAVLAAVSAVLALGAYAAPPVRPLLEVLALAYAAAAAAGTALALRILQRERRFDLTAPERLLLVSPHQDDCVLMAGGYGLRNTALGGRTLVVYLTRPADPAEAQTRRREAEAAWALAGVPPTDLRHLDLMPPDGPVTASHVAALREALQAIVDEVRPTVIFTPLFEGGHLHHDVAAHVVTRMLRVPGAVRIYQAPEYSPYLSIWRTPDGALSYLARLASFGAVAYYPRPEGVGEGPILNLRLSAAELAAKRRMLASFETQSGPALARHHGFADRAIAWRDQPFRATPFRYEGSRPWLANRLRRFVPAALVRRLLPGEPGTIGLACGVTNLDVLLHVPARQGN